MKLTPSTSVLLGALYLLQSANFSAEAFTSQGPRIAKPTTITKWGKDQQQPILGRSQTATTLYVSSIQDRLKEFGESMDVDDSNPFMQQLKKPLSFSERELGLLVLLTVPVAWGTYASTVQTIYKLDPQVPGFMFSTCYFFIAASGSLAATFWNSSQQEAKGAEAEPKSVPAIAGLELGLYVYLANFLHVIGLQSVPSDRAGFLFQCM